MKIKIKPLSVNEAWRGRRFKTPKYSVFQAEMLYILPKVVKLPSTPKWGLRLNFGLSSPLSDVDSSIKQTIDVLQKKYNFNDKIIFKLEVLKTKVKISEEFIEFEFFDFEG